jgi:hypothetical protein
MKYYFVIWTLVSITLVYHGVTEEERDKFGKIVVPKTAIFLPDTCYTPMDTVFTNRDTAVTFLLQAITEHTQDSLNTNPYIYPRQYLDSIRLDSTIIN